MLAQCSSCGATIEDPMTGIAFACPHCGTLMASRAGDLAEAHSPALRSMARAPPGGFAPPPVPPPGEGMPPPPDWGPPPTAAPMMGMGEFFRYIAHAIVLLVILSTGVLVVVCLYILAWGYQPVEDAALAGLLSSSVIAIAPMPVGEACWTGLEALGYAAVLVALGAALEVLRRSGRVPGLSGAGTLVVALSIVAAGAGVLVWAGYLATTGHLTEEMVCASILPTPVGLMRLKWHAVAYWHGLIVGVILASAAVMAARDGPELVATLRRSLARRELPTIRSDNAWFSVFRIYLAFLAFNVVYFLVLRTFTVEPSVPPFDEQPVYWQLHAFAEASFWEEVLSRVLMLGLPLLVHHTISGRMDVPYWRYLVGGGFRIDSAAATLIFIQAMVFALAHVAGWDLWKVAPTVVAGAGLGYLFLKRGLYAAIMLHFTIDYMGIIPEAFEAMGLDVWIPFALAWLSIILVGLIVLVHYMYILATEGPSILRRLLELQDGGGGGDHGDGGRETGEAGSGGGGGLSGGGTDGDG